jgi:hypothetical protein
MDIYRVARVLLIIRRENMSFDMEPYSVAKELEDGYDGTRLRVRFKGDLIGFASTYAEAYDIMEEHANSPCVSTEVSADMADMEQQIIDLAQEVDYMEAERDYWKELSGDATKAVDAERKRSWEENKQFQWELAEQNAELRKQLGEKHDDNCRLQRSLAEEHNKLKVALQLGKTDITAPEASDPTLRMSITGMQEHLHAQLERLTSMVETLWEERYDS